MIPVSVTVNGIRYDAEVAPHTTLLEFLRERLHLTGTKEGCGVGECGTCLVLVDGTPVNSCLMLVADAAGRRVETVEGLADDGRLDEVQAAFVAVGAVQCGFCTPAMVLCTEGLLRINPRPTPEEAAAALAGVLCRCGSYPKVLEAVRIVAAGGDGP